jgi:CCR4-NOT transcription complex subunit 6
MKENFYTWHLSLRVDRPLEGCTLRPHSYMYGKKLDERDNGSSANAANMGMPTKKSKDPPPQHEFSYRWFRGPLHEPCAYEKCPRNASFSPHDWSRHALGGTECSIQCVSTQSSLFRRTFCNTKCFVEAWKTQYTIPKEMVNYDGGYSGGVYTGPTGTGGGFGGANSRSATPNRSRSGSYASDDNPIQYGNITNNTGVEDANSTRSIDSKSPSYYVHNNNGGGEIDGGSGGTVGNTNITSNPGTPRGYVGGYTGPNNNTVLMGGGHRHTGSAGGPYYVGGGQAAEDWMEVSRDQFYIPGPDDVGRKLKLEATAYSNDTGEMLMARVVKTDVVLARAPDPSKRSLVTAKGISGSAGGARFRIATYNVLAEIYATQTQYPYCDFWALSWDYRFQNMLREILDASPDVLCLQEIQADHYENHVYAALSDAGYEGVYKQKTRPSMGLAGKVDGCALFWRRSKFHLVESYSIEFNEVAQRQATQVLGLNPRSEEGIQFLNRLSKDNVAQLVVLEFIQQQPPPRGTRGDIINQICVANTHLYSNKDFPDVKLWQSWQLLQELESFIVSRGSNLPLTICGDFNSTPDTAVYDLLSRQSVHPGHPDVNVATNDDNVPNILPDPMNITHSFSLGSTYHSVLGEEPWVTNYTVNFKGVLDYIWYSTHNLRPLSAAPVPDEERLTRNGEALPSTEYSSDHVMLISDMQVLNAR